MEGFQASQNQKRRGQPTGGGGGLIIGVVIIGIIAVVMWTRSVDNRRKDEATVNEIPANELVTMQAQSTQCLPRTGYERAFSIGRVRNADSGGNGVVTYCELDVEHKIGARVFFGDNTTGENGIAGHAEIDDPQFASVSPLPERLFSEFVSTASYFDETVLGTLDKTPRGVGERFPFIPMAIVVPRARYQEYNEPYEDFVAAQMDAFVVAVDESKVGVSISEANARLSPSAETVEQGRIILEAWKSWLAEHPEFTAFE